MKTPIDRCNGTGFVDHESGDGRICVREEMRGEVFRMTSAEYWHLNQVFEGRSLFFGSGIRPFIDPLNRFLILRDAAVILLFDYSEKLAWNCESPWGYCPGVKNFPEIEFTDDAILIGRFRESIPRDRLDRFFSPGLGGSANGFLTHWRPIDGHENEYSVRLRETSVLLRNSECEQAVAPNGP